MKVNSIRFYTSCKIVCVRYLLFMVIRQPKHLNREVIRRMTQQLRLNGCDPTDVSVVSYEQLLGLSRCDC